MYRTMKGYFSPYLPLCYLLQTELNLSTRISVSILADWITGGSSRKIRSFLCSTNNCLLIPRHLWASVLCAALRTWGRSHRPCSLGARSLMGGISKRKLWTRGPSGIGVELRLTRMGQIVPGKGRGKPEESRSQSSMCRAQVRTWHTRELELTVTPLNIERREAGAERWRWRALFDRLRSLVADWKAVGSDWKTSPSAIRWD